MLPEARFRRESLTVEYMLRIYCRDKHQRKDSLCENCASLLQVAKKRLSHCPHSIDKPTCAKCTVHCYAPQDRDKITQVMRYSGPRMFFRHPVYTIRHLFDSMGSPRPVDSMRRFYNKVHSFYGIVEWHLGKSLDQVVQNELMIIPVEYRQSALELACGSGLWTGKIAPTFQHVVAMDQSKGMLHRAQMRVSRSNIQWQEGNLFDLHFSDNSKDVVFMSFALHLFSKAQRIQVLKQMLQISKYGVCIIDHNRKWDALTAFVEWVEGSHYKDFIQDDFVDVSIQLGCRSWSDQEIAGCRILWFYK